MEKKERERVDGLKTQIEALQQTNAQLKATVAEVKNIDKACAHICFLHVHVTV